MAYATYQFYTGSFKGSTIPADAFNALIERASDELDALTFHRITAVHALTDAVQKAACAVADSIYLADQRGADVESEQIGSHHITYAQRGRSGGSAHTSAALKYLGDTGLMYRGGGRNDI